MSTGTDDTPLAPDLQLDWSSSSESDDEAGSVEVLGTVNNSNRVSDDTSRMFLRQYKSSLQVNTEYKNVLVLYSLRHQIDNFR